VSVYGLRNMIYDTNSAELIMENQGAI